MRRSPGAASCARSRRRACSPALSVRDNVMIGLHLRGARRRLRHPGRPPRPSPARKRGWPARPRRSSRSSASATAATRRPAPCRTASSGSWSWRWRWPRARALLLLDEPAAGMTGAEKERLVELVRRVREQGVTVFLVEHDMRLVMGISDTVIVLNHGRVIAEGPPAAIQAHPDVIRAYLGVDGVLEHLRALRARLRPDRGAARHRPRGARGRARLPARRQRRRQVDHAARDLGPAAPARRPHRRSTAGRSPARARRRSCRPASRTAPKAGASSRT